MNYLTRHSVYLFGATVRALTQSSLQAGVNIKKSKYLPQLHLMRTEDHSMTKRSFSQCSRFPVITGLAYPFPIRTPHSTIHDRVQCAFFYSCRRLMVLPLLGTSPYSTDSNSCLEARQRELERTRSRNGKKHPDVLKSLNHVAAELSNLGRHEEALAIIREAIELGKKIIYEDEHPVVKANLHFMARTLLKLGRYEEALATLTLCERELGEPLAIAFVKSACYQKDIGIAQMYLGHHQEALKNLEESLRYVWGTREQLKAVEEELKSVEEETLKVIKAIQQSVGRPKECGEPCFPSFKTKPMTETLYNELIRENYYREYTINDAYKNKKNVRNRRMENIALILMICFGGLTLRALSEINN